MLSTFSTIGEPFSFFEFGFTHWDSQEPLFPFHEIPQPEYEPAISSPNPSQEPVSPNSGSTTVTPNSGSEEPNRKKKNDLTQDCDPLMDERKRRRMVSNRESARRSRMRKQKHLENMRSQLTVLKVANRELIDRLRLEVHQNQLVRTENECLRSEGAVLRQRLWDIRQVLLIRELQHRLNPAAWQCDNITSVN